MAGGTVYVPDWGGKLWAVSAATGQALWSRTITSYDGIPGDVSRTSPAYDDGELVIGTGANSLGSLQGAYVIGIDARTGAMRWRTKVDPDPATIVTGAPTIDDGVVYVGTSSKEEGLQRARCFAGRCWRSAPGPARSCGALHRSGVHGRRGVGQPAGRRPPDRPALRGHREQLHLPARSLRQPGPLNCAPRDPADHMDSIVAMSLPTGPVEWSKATLSADTWTIPMPNGSPDFDFGTTRSSTRPPSTATRPSCWASARRAASTGR